MRIKFNGTYKSLKSFESDDLDDFTVITGKNGSGKSNLVEALGFYKNNKPIPIGEIQIDGIRRQEIQIEGIIQEKLTTVSSEKWKQLIREVSSIYLSLGPISRELFDIVNKNYKEGFYRDESALKKTIRSNSDLDPVAAIEQAANELNPQSSSQGRSRASDYEIVSNYLLDSRRVFVSIAAAEVAEFRNKSVLDLVEADFLLSPIPDALLSEPKLFGAQLEMSFYNYAKRRDQNRRAYFDKEIDGVSNSAISDEEFVKRNPQPWVVLNKLLEGTGLNFEFKSIEKELFAPETDIDVELIKTTTGKSIHLHLLSSGEKVIIGIIIKLFLTAYYKDTLRYPEMLVLDEPDAYLHPEMSRTLLEVLHQKFSKELGIKVILITHSPSTVALCPEGSIFEMKNEPQCSLTRISKDSALKLLTEFIPTLSIDYQNHKQVFVESPTDVSYYQAIFDRLNEDKDYPFNLYFISNASGKGNCEQVKKIVYDLRVAGNNSSFGIIDWDLKNDHDEFVFVHGRNTRYSIENFIFDPIYVVVLLLGLEAHDIHASLGLEVTFNELKISEKDTGFLQKAIDWYFTVIQPNKVEGNDDRCEVTYLSGHKLEIPKWYLTKKGHDVKDIVVHKFTALNKYDSSGSLELQLVKTMVKCYPLIPRDSEELVDRIMKSGQ
jgi:AAA15 family ATPase/GTPase